MELGAVEAGQLTGLGDEFPGNRGPRVGVGQHPLGLVAVVGVVVSHGCSPGGLVVVCVHSYSFEGVGLYALWEAV